MPKYIVSPRPMSSPGWPHDKSPVECDSYRAALKLVEESLSQFPSQELYVARVSGKFKGSVKMKRQSLKTPAAPAAQPVAPLAAPAPTPPSY